jgi:pyroglutamyl-peptidase
MEKRILVTGFDPFGGDSLNSAWEAVRALPDRLGETELCKLQIPTVFSLAAGQVIGHAERLQVQGILCVGQASSRSSITPERIGINLRCARIPDNAGRQPQQEPVIPGGPDGLFSTVNVSAMVRAICEAGLPAQVSNTAGTFVCNDVLYSLLYYFRHTDIQVGFIHVPRLGGQLSREQITLGLSAAIRQM